MASVLLNVKVTLAGSPVLSVAVTDVVSLVELFPVFGSGVELPTVTLFVKTPTADAATLRVTTREPTAKSPIEHVTSDPEAPQLAPDQLIRTIDEGKVSMKPADLATAGPAFVTVMLYATVLPTRTGSCPSLFDTRRSAPAGAVDGLVEGVVDGLVEGVVDGLVEGVVDGLVEGVVDALVEGVVDGLVEGVVDGLVEGVVDGLVVGVVDGPVVGVVDGPVEGVVVGPVVGVVVGPPAIVVVVGPPATVVVVELVVGPPPPAVVVVEVTPPMVVDVEELEGLDVVIPPTAPVVVASDPPPSNRKAAPAPPMPPMIPTVFPLTPPVPASPAMPVAFKNREIPSAWNPGGRGVAPTRVAPTAMSGLCPV